MTMKDIFSRSLNLTMVAPIALIDYQTPLQSYKIFFLLVKGKKFGYETYL